jgi:hypothetical protein
MRVEAINSHFSLVSSFLPLLHDGSSQLTRLTRKCLI